VFIPDFKTSGEKTKQVRTQQISLIRDFPRNDQISPSPNVRLLTDRFSLGSAIYLSRCHSTFASILQTSISTKHTYLRDSYATCLCFLTFLIAKRNSNMYTQLSYRAFSTTNNKDSTRDAAANDFPADPRPILLD